MDQSTYLWELELALGALVPLQERTRILREYEARFDEVGIEGEDDLIDELGEPKYLARKLAVEGGYAKPAPDPSSKGVSQKKLVIATLIAAAIPPIVILLLVARFRGVG